MTPPPTSGARPHGACGTASRAAEDIEEVLAKPVSQGTLCEIVMREGNHPLAERTDEAVRSWLRELAGDLRAWLGEHAPSTSE